MSDPPRTETFPAGRVVFCGAFAVQTARLRRHPVLRHGQLVQGERNRACTECRTAAQLARKRMTWWGYDGRAKSTTAQQRRHPALDADNWCKVSATVLAWIAEPQPNWRASEPWEALARMKHAFPIPPSCRPPSRHPCGRRRP